MKGFVIPKRPAAVGHHDLKLGKVHGDLLDVNRIAVEGLGARKVGSPGMEHHYLSGTLEEFVEGIQLAVIGIEILVGREKLEAADPMALDVRHHNLRDVGVVRIDRAKRNQLRVSLAKIEDEIVGNAPGYRGVVGNADGVVNALALKEINESLRSHQSFHRLHKGRAQLGKLFYDSGVPESPVTYVGMEVDHQCLVTSNRQFCLRQHRIRVTPSPLAFSE